jgi:MFS family permease
MSAEAPSRLARLTAPPKRLMAVAFMDDGAVACMQLGVQWLACLRLHASPLMLGLLPTGSAAAYTGACLISGPLSDRFGRRRPAMVSCFVTGIVWLLMFHVTSATQLLCLTPLSGAALALLWPSVQAWLAEFCGDNSKRLNRTISLFNLSWSGGIMVGPLFAGYLWERGYQWPFIIPALLSFACFGLLLVTPPGQDHQHHAPPTVSRVSPEKARLFLYLAWIANFASWFCRGTVGSMFPKLGETLGFSEPLQGTLIFVLSFALFFMFGIARLSNRWQYHLRVLLAAQVFGIAGMLITARAVTPTFFVIGFSLAGLCSGVTYVSSLIYALEGASRSRGKRSGLHEAVLGVGIIIGPLAAGFLGQHVSLRAPFTAAALVFALAMIAQGVVWWKLKGANLPVAGSGGQAVAGGEANS